MSGCIIPEGYTPRLNVYETQRAIEFNQEGAFRRIWARR